MKTRFIPGLIALQLAAALTASAQNYYIKISGDENTFVADHASWEQGAITMDETIEAYNLRLPGGNNAVGMMRFYSPAGTVGFASHHRLNSPGQVVARKILMPAYNNGLYLIGEKLATNGAVKSVAVMQYDVATGHLNSSNELPHLPNGYSFVRVYDVISEPDFANRMRILITVSDGSAETIMELLYNAGSNTYKVKKYKPATIPPENYYSVYYVRAYHYGEFNLGEISFYGMGYYKDKPVAYCYADGKYEQYHLTSARGIEGISGVQMNGSYGAHGDHHRIDMAFIDMEGGLCIQQKDEMTTLNWRRFYNIQDARFQMGWGRDGHGTKAGGGMDYFMAATHFRGDDDNNGHVTSLHYDAFNGDLHKPNVYNLSGIGVHKGGGFPNTNYDPLHVYTFIADRFNQVNGFKLATGKANNDELPCTKPVPVKEIRNPFKEQQDEMTIELFGAYPAPEMELVEVIDISVDVIKECKEELRGTAANSKLLHSSSAVHVSNNNIRVEATGKTITALRLLTIDGRVLSNVSHINSSRYEQQLNTPLIPGIYVLSIVYDDQSIEHRKVSIQ